MCIFSFPPVSKKAIRAQKLYFFDRLQKGNKGTGPRGAGFLFSFLTFRDRKRSFLRQNTVFLDQKRSFSRQNRPFYRKNGENQKKNCAWVPLHEGFLTLRVMWAPKS